MFNEKQVINMQTMREEFARRAKIAGLNVECAMDGIFGAQLAIIAEAPGYNEVAKKSPLVGASGTFFWNHARKYNVTRTSCYITNMSKRQVSFPDKGKVVFNKHERELWRDMLLWELQQLPNLSYVFVMGGQALWALTGHEKALSWRGSVLPVELPNRRKIQVVCSINPAAIIRDPSLEIIFLFDLGKLDRTMRGKLVNKPIHTHINPTYAEAIEYLEMIHGEALSTGNPISTDIEVISNETACIGFAASSTEAMCINWRGMSEDRYDVVQERNIRKRVQQLYADERVKFIAQNGMFDLTWMWYKDCIKIHKIWFDTMLAHHTLYPTLPHNLGFITTQYTDHPYYKDEKSDWREGGNIDDFWMYNGKDCCITYSAAIGLQNELRAQNLEDFFFSHVMHLQPVLARMTVGGVLMDMELKERIREEVSEDVGRKLRAFHSAVHTATGDNEFNPNPKSPAQLSNLFFNKLRLVGRGTSTDEENRKRMFAHPRTSEEAKRVITTLDEFIKDNKFLATYAEMQVDPDNRARCTYNQTGVQSAPGRLSSSKTLWGSGMNLQNQPTRSQPMFVADPGYSFGYFDMAQAEARLVAYFARIDKWKAQFERARIDGSYDAHRALASDMFKIPYDDVPTADEDAHGNKTLRYIAKRCRHGLNYRMEPDRLAQTTGLKKVQALQAYAAYHRETPELRDWWAELEKEVRKTKTLFNAFGRRLMILERLTEEAMESIVAFKPQSTLGDHVCRVMYQSENDSRWPSHARMVLNIHDALIILAPHEQVKTALAIAKHYAEQPILIDGEPLIIPADTKISVPVSWASTGLNEAGEPIMGWVDDPNGLHRWSSLKKVKL